MRKIKIYIAGLIFLCTYGCGSNDDTTADANRINDSLKQSKEQRLIDSVFVIKGNNVNVRTEPSLKASLIWISRKEGKKSNFQLSDGNYCKMLVKGSQEKIGENTNYWYKIKYHSMTGWVFGAFTELLKTDVQNNPAIFSGSYTASLVEPEIDGGDGVSQVIVINANEGRTIAKISTLVEGVKNNEEGLLLKHPVISGCYFTSEDSTYKSGVFVTTLHVLKSGKLLKGLLMNGELYEKFK